MRKIALFVLSLIVLGGTGCSSEDIPQAHKGRLFNKTGVAAFWIGGNGFDGPILGPGTYYTGIYNEIRQVDCSTNTVKEHMESLTKDGVQFGLDTYVRYSADCKDQTVSELLSSMVADVNSRIISNKLLYETFIRPSLGEAVRESISPKTANEINSKREEILTSIRAKFETRMKEKGGVTLIKEFVLSNLTFPPAMNAANNDRAVQAILKETAIAEREKVTAQTETTRMKVELAKKQGEVEAARIDMIGAALRRNPDFLQYDMQAKMPEIYKEAGANGNMVVTAPSPSVLVTPRPKK